MGSNTYKPWYCEVKNKKNEIIYPASAIRKLIVDGKTIWDKYAMEEQVEISGSYGTSGSSTIETIRVNNVTPYPITITKIENSMLNNGNYNVTIAGGDSYRFSKSTRFALGGYTITITYTCDKNTHTRDIVVPF